MSSNDLLDYQESANVTSERPLAITIICVLGFVGTLALIPILFSGIASQIGAWYPPFLIFASIVGFTCMVGLWKMKKWAVYLYAGMAIINQLIMVLMGLWTITSLIAPAIVTGIAIYHLDKMD